MRITYYNFISKKNPDGLFRFNPNKAGLFESSFFWDGERRGSISRRLNAISI